MTLAGASLRRTSLRDQALSFCRLVTPEARESFGASSLATIVQMVAHGYGITLGPVNEVTPEGLPILFVKDIPPQSSIAGSIASSSFE